MKTARIIRRNTPKSRRRSAAITTTVSGIVTYRTRRPLSESAAVRFARMVQANPRFLDATVVPSRAAAKFHVCFMPNSVERITAMLNAEDKKDVDAMRRDGRHFLYTPCARAVALPGYRDVFHCIGITGEYETTLSDTGACSCPHFKYRRANSGGECKHIKELRRRQEAGIVAAPVGVPVVFVPVLCFVPVAQSAETARRIAADFD